MGSGQFDVVKECGTRRAAAVLNVIVAIAVMLIGVPTAAWAAPGDLDPSFAPTFDYYGSPATVRTIVVQPDGRILVGGHFSSVNGAPRRGIARLNADGTLDTTFDPPLFSDADVRAIHLYGNGEILIGGAIFLDGTMASLRQLVPLSPSGGQTGDIDLSSLTHDDDSNVLTSMLVEPTGGVVIGGGFFFLKDTNVQGLARIDLSTGAVQALGTVANLGADTGSTLTINRIVPQAGGKLLVAGTFTPTTHRGLVRLNSDGTVDETFIGPGVNQAAIVTSLALEAAGTILVGGTFDSLNGQQNTLRFARLNADGSVNTNHAPFVMVGASGPNDIMVQGDGKILLGGALGDINNVTRNGVARLNSGFSIDPFYPNPGGVNGSVSALALGADGNVLIGGFFTQVAGVPRASMARLLDVPNNAPQLTGVSITPAVDEGQIATLTGSVSDADAGDQLTLSINWGDGSAVESADYSSGANFSRTHQYADDNPTATASDVYTVTVGLSDGKGGSDAALPTLTVNNLAPTLSNVSLLATTINAGDSASLSGNVGDAGTLDPHTVVINWGDGSTTTTLNRAATDTSFSTSHQYTVAGSFNIAVTLSDDDLGQATGGASVTVNPAVGPPAAPSNLNAIVTSTRVGKSRVYSGALTWNDNSNNEESFIVQRYKLGKKNSCALETTFATVVLAANTTSYTDATATSSTCGYQVAAKSGNLTSTFARDLNVGTSITP